MAEDYDDIDDFLADSGSEFEPESESDEESIASDADMDLSPVRTRKPKTPKAQQKKDSNTVGKPTKRVLPTTKDRSSPKKKAKVAVVSHFCTKPMKPFTSLMDDVVFVISGFQNPLRSDIRNSALAMGAKYKADWDSTCTHLVCAFRNTPKCNQVRGSGKIVKKDWIEKCYESRKRFPWRRFALDPSDQNQPESEEEILEDTGPPPASLDNRRRVNDSSSEDEIEKEVKRIKKQQRITPKPRASPKPGGSKDKIVNGVSDDDEADTKDVRALAGPSGVKTNPSPLRVIDDRDSEQVPVTSTSIASSAKPKADLSIYEVETEEEASDGEEHSAVDVLQGLPVMPSYFEGYYFLVLDDIEESQRATLKRYILARLGKVVSDVQELSSSSPTFCITEDKSRLEEVKQSFPDVTGVRPDWVWLCHDENALQDVGSHGL